MNFNDTNTFMYIHIFTCIYVLYTSIHINTYQDHIIDTA
jgi:hypothetical protein